MTSHNKTYMQDNMSTSAALTGVDLLFIFSIPTVLICFFLYKVDNNCCNKPCLIMIFIPCDHICVLCGAGTDKSLVSISLVSHGLYWTIYRPVKVHAVHSYTNGALPNCQHATVASSRLPAISWMFVHWKSLMVDYNCFTKLKMMQSSGWSLQRLQHSQNEMKWTD